MWPALSPCTLANCSKDIQRKDETVWWYAFLIICNLIYVLRLKFQCLESSCEAFLCWFALFSAKPPPLIRKRKCLRCFRVRADLEDKQLNLEEVEQDKHIYIIRVLKRGPEIQ